MEHSTWPARLLEILNGYMEAGGENLGMRTDTIVRALGLPAVRQAMRVAGRGSAQARTARRMEALRRLEEEAYLLEVGSAPRRWAAVAC